MTSSDVSVPSGDREFLKFAEDAIQESDGFLRSHDGYDKFQDIIEAIMGEYIGIESRPSNLLSSVTLNHFGKVASDMVAAQTDIKPFWDYRTYNKRFEQQSQLANKLASAWWMGRHVTLRFADVIKFATAMGTGYAHQAWNGQWNDLEMIPEDPRDVLPIRPGSFLSIQEAQGVIIRRERTVNWIKAKYGERAQAIKADRDGSLSAINKSTRFSRLMGQLGFRSGFMDNLFASLAGRPQAKPLNIPTCDLYTMYITDDSINTSGVGTWMGLDMNSKRKTNWSYYVPAVGELNKATGEAFSEESPEVRLYPRKRCIIFTKSGRIYDDTSIYWHGMFPLAKLTIDPWPWAWLGKSPLKDLLPLHAETNKLMRIMSQHADKIRRPGIAYDKNAVSREAAARIDTERAGLKLAYRPTTGKPLELLTPAPLDPFIFEYMKFLLEQMDSQSGNLDVSQITNLGQMPSLDTIDRLIASMAVTNRLRSQVIEVFMSEFAMMLLMNFFQFYTRAQRVAILGQQGQTLEDFDYDPDSLIPDMLDMGMTSPEGTIMPRYERAREFYRYFTYQIAPGSLLNSASMQDKMIYMQLARAGLLDPITLLEKLGVPNLGVPPDLPTGVLQRMIWCQQNGIGMQVNPAGRKATGQTGPRTKVTESK